MTDAFRPHILHGIRSDASDRFLNPNGIQAAYVSLSLIDRLHAATYYPCGQILNVPSACILAAGPKDLGIGNLAFGNHDVLKEDIENAALRSQNYKVEDARTDLGAEMYPSSKLPWGRKTEGPATAREQMKVMEKFTKKKEKGKYDFPAKLTPPDDVLSHTPPQRPQRDRVPGHGRPSRITVVGLFVTITNADTQIKEALIDNSTKPAGVHDNSWTAIKQAMQRFSHQLVAIKYDEHIHGRAK